tara:strand:- start:6574 stop:7428 length:855 start_codon:yes stop_codon:yes gene_type:complete
LKIVEVNNFKFIGTNGRHTLIDVLYPEKVENIPLIIFAHGFKGFKDWGHFPLIARKFAESGFAILKFNFSHNGGTIEQPIDFPDLEAFSKNNYIKEQQDLSLILDWVSKGQNLPISNWNRNNIYLIGHSRGGSMVTLKATHDKRVKKVVSWAAVSNLFDRLPSQEEIRKWKEKGVRYIANTRTNQQMPMKFQFVETLFKYKDELNIEAACKHSTIPQLIIHGSNDEAVPVQMAYDLKEWNPQAKLKIIDGAGHTFGGKHPWNKSKLPKHTLELLNETITFLKRD